MCCRSADLWCLLWSSEQASTGGPVPPLGAELTGQRRSGKSRPARASHTGHWDPLGARFLPRFGPRLHIPFPLSTSVSGSESRLLVRTLVILGDQGPHFTLMTLVRAPRLNKATFRGTGGQDSNVSCFGETQFHPKQFLWVTSEAGPGCGTSPVGEPGRPPTPGRHGASPPAPAPRRMDTIMAPERCSHLPEQRPVSKSPGQAVGGVRTFEQERPAQGSAVLEVRVQTFQDSRGVGGLRRRGRRGPAESWGPASPGGGADPSGRAVPRPCRGRLPPVPMR